MVTGERAQVALQRWLAALNNPKEGARVAAAVNADITIWRHGNYAQRGEIVERFAGLEQARGWVARCPLDVAFALDGQPTVTEAGAGQARYVVLAEGFRGGGLWRFRLGADGRIDWLEHIPDELDPRYIFVDAGDEEDD